MTFRLGFPQMLAWQLGQVYLILFLGLGSADPEGEAEDFSMDMNGNLYAAGMLWRALRKGPFGVG